jgi:hypothetical protein
MKQKGSQGNEVEEIEILSDCSFDENNPLPVAVLAP